MVTLYAIYHELYNRADALLRERNPCGLAVDPDGLASCNRTRRDPGHRNYQRGALCCRDCPHLGPQGCTIRALGCKLSHCSGWGHARNYTTLAGWPDDVADRVVDLVQMAVSLGVPLLTREPLPEEGGP